MRKNSAFVLVLVLFCLKFISCTPSVNSSSIVLPQVEEPEQPETAEPTEMPEQPETAKPTEETKKNPSVKISYDDDSAFSGKELSFTIAFTDYDFNPTVVDVFIENTSTAYTSNVSVNSNKVMVTVPSTFSARTICFYVKAGEVESNHISLKYGYLVSVDEFENFINSLPANDTINIRVTGDYYALKEKRTLLQGNKKIQLDLSKMTTDTSRPNSSQWDNFFFECNSLVEIQMPETLKYIGSETFQGCENLEKIIIPDDCILSGESIFWGCKKLKSIKIPSATTVIGNYNFDFCEHLNEIIMHDGITKIGTSAFAYCDSVMYISLPKNLITIGETAFNHCQALQEITIPYSVTSIGKNAFTNTSSSRKVVFENKNGWKAGDTMIAESDLEDPVKANKLLRREKNNVAWNRISE